MPDTLDVGDHADLIPSLTLALTDPGVREIVLAPGTYVEHVTIGRREQPLTIRSKSGRAEDVVLTFGLCQGHRDSGGMELLQDCASLTVDADDVTIIGVTIENSFDKTTYTGRGGGQALALRTRGDRIRLEDCVLRGRQDTVLLDSRSYGAIGRTHLLRCRIEGDIDFVYGKGTALLEECEIRSLGPGYVAAPSTARENPRGFLFLRCDLTAAEGVPPGSVHLGRPWHPGGKPDALGQAVFAHCHLGEHIAEEPWSGMGGFDWRDARLAEVGNTGPGAAVRGDRPQLESAPRADEWLTGWHPWPRRTGTIHVVGDSTAADYPVDLAPREGWGQRLGEAVDRQVLNHASSGASSLSFIDEGRLDKVLDMLEPHDLLLVQFGHNDAKEDHRGTDVFTQFAAQLRRYLVGARARGAVPVLLTPVERRRFDAEGRAVATHGGYPQRVRDLAMAEEVPLVDVARLSRARWQEMGPEQSKTAFLWLHPDAYAGFPEGEQDDTHLSTDGARAVAAMVAAGLRAQGVLDPLVD